MRIHALTRGETFFESIQELMAFFRLVLTRSDVLEDVDSALGGFKGLSSSRAESLFGGLARIAVVENRFLLEALFRRPAR